MTSSFAEELVSASGSDPEIGPQPVQRLEEMPVVAPRRPPQQASAPPLGQRRGPVPGQRVEDGRHGLEEKGAGVPEPLGLEAIIQAGERRCRRRLRSCSKTTTRWRGRHRVLLFLFRR